MRRAGNFGKVAAGVFVAALAAALWLRFGSWNVEDDSSAAAARAHPMDPEKRAEHKALLDLMPGEGLPTHVAAQDGSWFDASTWVEDAVPGEGAIVHVPPSVAVTYEGEAAEHLFMIRVDGSLRVQAHEGRDTRMVVDTLFSTPESTLAIESGDPGDGSVEIELRPFDIEAYEARGAPAWSRSAKGFYSDGATVTDTGAGTRPPAAHRAVEDGAGVLGRHRWDPEQLSLGLIAHGAVRIVGREKLGRAAIARTARKGDTSILLAAEPGGWSTGDVIVVTGVQFVGRDLVSGAYRGSQDELRTVTAVDGREVGLDRPLEYDHDTPREGLVAYAANLTRNVLVRSGEDQPLEVLDPDVVGGIASRLGHVMFMHVDDVTVRHAAFDDLGRTNKNDVLDDFRRRGYDGLDAARLVEAERTGGRDHVADPRTQVRTAVDQVTNTRGRYSVHLHRTGATKDRGKSLVEGSVVTGGPGWGFVSHDSRADFLGNVTYGVLGAGFVAETGNETGTWEGNIAINTYGADFNSRALDPHWLYRFENDDFDRTLLLEKRSAWKNHDFGHFGNGFWLQGKLIDMKDNVSVNSGANGYFYMFRAPDLINVSPELLVEPLSVHSPRGIHPFAPGLNVFTGNQSIADRCGLTMIGIGGGRTNDERSVIADFTAWELGQLGTYAEYYPGYTIKDSTFLASTGPDASPIDGVLFLKAQMDTVLANLTIEGFPQKYDLKKSWSPGAVEQQGFDDPYDVIARARAEGRPNPLPLGYAHVVIDGGFSREQASEERFLGRTHREEDLILTSDQLEIGRFEVELDDASLRIDLDKKKIRYGILPDDPIRPTLQEGHVLLLEGTKTDSIGSVPLAYLNNVLVWHEDAVQHRLETEGYYRMPSGARGVVLEELLSDRYTAEKHLVRFVAELDPRWSLAGAIDRGAFDASAHPSVHVPGFLMAE